MKANAGCEIVFPDWYDERGEADAESKGWLQGVAVRLPSGESQSLFIYDPVRLAQDLEEETKTGTPFVACPGLIVIPHITRQAIVSAVNKLIDEGYFPIQQRTIGSISEVIHDARIGSPAA